jgi:hypothetical protein
MLQFWGLRVLAGLPVCKACWTRKLSPLPCTSHFLRTLLFPLWRSHGLNQSTTFKTLETQNEQTNEKSEFNLPTKDVTVEPFMKLFVGRILKCIHEIKVFPHIVNIYHLLRLVIKSSIACCQLSGIRIHLEDSQSSTIWPLTTKPTFNIKCLSLYIVCKALSMKFLWMIYVHIGR